MKTLIKYNLGEKIEDSLIDELSLGLLNKPVKLVKIKWTFLDKDGITMDYSLKVKDFNEDIEEVK